MAETSISETAQILTEALPFLQRYDDQIIVVKFGGHAMVDEKLASQFARDMVMLKVCGLNPIVVHGGGPQINKMLDKLAVKAEFREGLRVTDPETMSVVEMVLAGSINKSIVASIQQAGGRAVGISGKDGNLLIAERYTKKKVDPATGKETTIDFGQVGEPARVNAEILNTIMKSDAIPVVAPIGVGWDGDTFNVNADTAAGAIASATGAKRLLLLTDVAGVLDSNKQLISELKIGDIQKLVDEGTITGGMIPKVESAAAVVEAGVEGVIILDGRVPHSVLLELLTPHGVGTRISRRRMRTFHHVETWVFDLDNTLYPASCRLFDQIDVKMGEYVSQLLGISYADAKKRQKELFYKHGTTLRGLMQEHGHAPQSFLDYVHDIDYSGIAEDAALADEIARLPGRKLVFTAGTVAHATRAMDQLGITHLFDDIFDIVHAEYVPKPQRAYYDTFLKAHDVDPRRAAMFEDIARNLVVPHDLGMVTVLVKSDHNRDANHLNEGAEASHVHHVTDDLAGFLRDVNDSGETQMKNAQAIIEQAWEDRAEVNLKTKGNIRKAVDYLWELDSGKARVAEKHGSEWHVNQWLKKAVLLSFRLNDMELIGNGPGKSKWWDKVPSKFDGWTAKTFRDAGFRAVPNCVVRKSAYIAPGAILMPSFVNLGAYVDTGTMVDTWVTVGSCAQIGKNVHLSGGVGIGGVLEPMQAGPTIIEDNCFIGARSEVVEGVVVGEGSVISMGVFIGQSTKIIDRTTGEVHMGKVPPYSVVVSGSLPQKPFADGSPSPSLYCAVIVKRVDEKTRSKTSINELLRD